VLGYPGAIVHTVLGSNPVETALSEIYVPPLPGYGPRSGDIDSNGVYLRIPTIVTTRSDASRPPVPIDRDQCEGAVRCIF
jgi:hypothetical protein